jgi:hypothetical protein
MIDKVTEKVLVEKFKSVRLLQYLGREVDESSFIIGIVNKIPVLEKEIILRKYLNCESEYMTHFKIYTEINMSEGTYTKFRLKGLYKIAISLGLIKPVSTNPIITYSNLTDRRQSDSENEVFLSEKDENMVINLLYEAGLYIMIGKELEGLPELPQAMKKLESIGADIILRKYLSREAEYTRHQTIYKELQMSPGTYKKHRLRALTELAVLLGL